MAPGNLAEFVEPDLPRPADGRGLCLTNNTDLPEAQRRNTGATARFDLQPNADEDRTLFDSGRPIEESDGVGLVSKGRTWVITVDLHGLYEITQIEASFGRRANLPFYIDVTVSDDHQTFRPVSRIMPGDKPKTDEFCQTKLFSTPGRFVRLKLQSKGRWTRFQDLKMVFDLREIRVWGHALN